MSTIIKFDLKELRKLANDKASCIVEKKVTQNLALQPWCLGNLKESLKNLLDYKIGKFDKEFNGILLSYKNLRVLQNVGTIRNDNADIHFQVQADYFIFQPYVGATLKGVVNKKSSTHLGILVHRVFNVVIPRPTEQPGNKWIGTTIQEGQEVVFQIVVLDLFGALPYIRGELDERWIKQGPDGDDEVVDSKSRSMCVSYVNFDKTKPNIQKQIGDGLPHSSSKTNSVCSKAAETTKQVKNNTVNNHVNAKNVESDVSMTEKNKSKRQTKTSEVDPKQMDMNQRLFKKHRKDI
ncbi:DNA-directed RNA polymerase I subunit RPA43 [Pectinophora gossypiella]|uniref:RPA43 OB domain-containing protein n=2 Tax=Pectinophora gossypiella TaxID=13191 RepID=A0A1E1W0P4_PECGO|nr:DNA-directed RNA polymerase I subunit RPA43 [Pectinophora gossypiella]